MVSQLSDPRKYTAEITNQADGTLVGTSVNDAGLLPATGQIFKLDSPRYHRRLFEVVISSSCPIVGLIVREGRFRNRYGAAIIAVAHDGQRVQGRIGDIVLKAGDTLLLEARTSFLSQYQDSKDFLLVTTLADSTPGRTHRANLAIGILVAMIAAATVGGMILLVAALLAAFAWRSWWAAQPSF